MQKKILITILGLGIIAGASFFVLHKKNVENVKNSEQLAIILFGEPVMLDLEHNVTFSDNLVVKFAKMTDSRCHAPNQCFWAGELGGSFELSGGKLSKTQTIYLGATTNKSASVENYNIYLNTITEKTSEIMVEEKK